MEEISLGGPIPASPHAISVSLPNWEDVLGYEEGESRVRDSLSTGYPRFVVHKKVAELFARAEARFARDGQRCFLFPSEKVASRALAYVRYHGARHVRIIPVDSHVAVFVSEEDAPLLKEYWQHFGEILSSRRAVAALSGEQAPAPSNFTTYEILRSRLANLYQQTLREVFLYPSGMAAIAAAWRISCADDRRRSVQFGFPYIDTLKIQERSIAGCYFLSSGDEKDLCTLEALLKERKVSTLFCEVASNPLLSTPDVISLSALLREHHVPLVIDDTVSSAHNLDLTAYADIIVTSLSKFFSGRGDVLAGSLILPRQSPFFSSFFDRLMGEYENLLWIGDAVVLERNSRDFALRMNTINGNGIAVAAYLARHPLVKEIYFSGGRTKKHYDAVRRTTGGYGGLLSIEFWSEEVARQFYNALPFAKGPGLGSLFTMACPYTLLAHYKELSWANSCGVSSHLIRVTVGTEPIDQILAGLAYALAQPKACPPSSKECTA